MFKTTQSPFAREVIERLQAVYAIEAEIRGNSAEQRLATRRTRSAALMAALKARLTEIHARATGQATRMAYHRSAWTLRLLWQTAQLSSAQGLLPGSASDVATLSETA